jgi:hypothetical protein
MTRLEKIILEQLKKGQFGERSADSTLSSKLNNKFKYGIISFYFVDTHGRGNKYDAFTADQVIERIPKSIKYITYSNGEYIFVIDEQNPSSGNKETTWNVYIIDKKKTFPNISDQVFAENKSGQFNQSFIITFKQYDELLKKQAELVAAKEKADAEAAAIAAAEKNKPAIEKTIVAVQNVINGTATIDVNNLGKGTPDAKAFQELLWQYGNKYPTQKSNTIYINFAKYRTKGPDGGWDGDIGPLTKKYITFLYGGLKVNTYTELIKKINLDLNQVQTESINYFKGTGINIKLKDLLQEQLLKEQDGFDFAAAEAAVNSSGSGGGGSSGAGTGTPVLWRVPANYTGKGTITYDNGNTYTGDWVAGKYNGQGTFSRKDGMSYTGAWLNNKYNGQGTYTWPNGNTYTGNFQNNLRNGDGKFYNAETKTTTQQTWKDGEKLLGIDDLYTQSVTNMSAVLLQLVNYVNNHEQFAGYKSMDDDEAAALIDLVKPWVQSNIQPKVTAHYNKYIKPYMSQYNVSDAALTVEYDEEFVGTNDSVTNIQNDKFRKMIQNYLVLEANSSDTALDDPATSAAYYNYAGDKSSYTIPAMFYWNKERSVHYWSLIGGRALFNVDTDF